MKNPWLAATVRHITLLVLLSTLLILFGTAGYMVLQAYPFIDALYMTVITLTTVGFGEIRPLDDTGRLFTIALILMGVGFIAYNLAYFSQAVMDENLPELYRRHRLRKQIEKLESHFIICGYGQMGQIIVRELLRHNVPVVVIDNDEATLHKLREKAILHIFGDSTEEEKLLEAGILKARGLVPVVTKDTDNVFIVLTARDLNKDLLILARAGTPGGEKRLVKAGADRVVSPYASGAIRIAHNILRPTVTDLLELALSGEGMELSMEELSIPVQSRLVGKDLIRSEIRSQYNLIVVGIKRLDGQMVYNPSPQEVLQAGDILVVIGPQENLARFGADLFGCPYPSPNLARVKDCK